MSITVRLVSHIELPDGVLWSRTGFYMPLKGGQWRWVCGITEIQCDQHLRLMDLCMEKRAAEAAGKPFDMSPPEEPRPITPENTDFYALTTASVSGDVEGYIRLQAAMDDWPLPEPDPTFQSRAGYVLPSGKFYPCIHMGHGRLAVKLAEHVFPPPLVDDPEKSAETEWHWARMNTDVDGRAHVLVGDPHRKMSRAMASSVSRWCKIHGAQLPECLR